jgi:hypothetical protein
VNRTVHLGHLLQIAGKFPCAPRDFLQGIQADLRVSRGCTKNISVFRKSKSGYKGCRPTPTKGRIMIVANAGWDAVDAGSVRHANACWTKTLIAYGEAVWS